MTISNNMVGFLTDSIHSAILMQASLIYMLISYKLVYCYSCTKYLLVLELLLVIFFLDADIRFLNPRPSHKLGHVMP